jgi:alpha-glucosidase
MTAANALAARSACRATLDEPHHDGSDLYVAERPDRLGGEAVVRLRVPAATAVERVALRYVRDGEPRAVVAELDEEGESGAWWRASFPVANPMTRYRWLLGGGDAGYAWLNGLGVVRHDVPDDDDFVLGLGGDGPEWHLRSAVYQIFPDRFAPGPGATEPPAWAVSRSWDDLPTGRGAETPFEWFGGNLAGVERHLDHIESLGASTIYLTPVFPAGSTHRYDAMSFERVDPLLGGDAALSSLVGAAHRRGMRVIGDLTLNHTGEGHDWFIAARDHPDAIERSFFCFDDSLPHGYESWLGVRSLPKLDHRAPELRRRLLQDRDSILRRWLLPPFDLDGWRIDVANMAGRFGEVDVGHDLAREIRRAVSETKDDALLVAEHAHDPREDLRARGWHGTMNYAGFLRPVWCWLRGGDPGAELTRQFLGLPVGVPELGATEIVATMRAFRAGVPWSSVLHSWTLLDSHDTARFRTVAGSRERHVVGLGLAATTPGVPMVFAGDEIGLEGEWGEDARRTMPWDRPNTWDTALLAEFRRLLALRRSSEALARGSIRYAFVDDDVLAYLRETAHERLLCLASRTGHEPVRLPLAQLGCRELETLVGEDAPSEDGEAVLPAEGPAFNVWRLA